MKKFYTNAVICTLLFLITGSSVFAQSAGDYRSVASANWGTLSTWQRYSGSTWATPTIGQGYPGQFSGTGSVTIQDNFNVTMNVSPANAIGSLVFAAGANQATLTISSTNTLHVTGAITMNGTATTSTGTNNVTSLSVGAGTLTCGSLSLNPVSGNFGSSNRRTDLLISTGTVTVTGSITCSGTITSTTGTGVYFSGAGTLNIGGDFFKTNIGVFTAANGCTVNYNGAAAQSVLGDSYVNIKFNGGGVKTLAGAATVTGLATFTNGVVNTTSGDLLTFSSTGTVTAANDNSFVQGPVAKTGTAAFTFPVGSSINNTGYHSIAITAASPSTTFTAEYVRASANTVGASLNVGIYRVSSCEYWNFARTGTATPSVTISWNANSGCGGSYINNLTGLILAYYNTTNARWEQSGGSATNNSSVSPYTTGTTQRTAVTTYGAITFGSVNAAGSPLPVKLGAVNAFAKNSGVSVEWTALTELSLSKYVVERSADGMNFTAIGSVTARNSTDATNYSFFDAAPAAGNNYYRLKSVDIDGKSSYSSIMKVNLEKSNAGFTLYPNPVRNGAVSFQSSELAQGTYTVKVMSVSGQQILAQQFNHNGGAISQSVQLPQSVKTGVYSLLIENAGARVMNKTFIVQ